MGIRVLYWISEEAHRRVVFSIRERSGFEQAIVLPTSISTAGFEIKDIRTYKDPIHIEKIINLSQIYFSNVQHQDT